MKLFQNKQRDYFGPANHSDDTYDFLNRSARDYAERVREELNKWFSNLPKEEKETMKRRFKTEFISAFFELFLHELYLKLGYDITIHPKIKGTSNCPDFLVKKDNIKFILEATVNTDLSNEEKRQKAIKQTYYDEINKIKSPKCFLRLIEVSLPKGRQPAGRKIRAFLKRKLENIDIDKLFNKYEEKGFEVLPTWTFEDEEGAFVKVQPIPKSNNTKEKENIRPIGMYPIETKWGGTISSLYSSLISKAGKYGNPDLPYIIAVNSLSNFGTDTYEVMEVLFGTLKYYINSNGEQTHMDRKPNGLFYGNKGIQYKRVSGVIVTTLLHTNLSKASFHLYHNPWAKKPFPEKLFPFTQYKAKNGNMVKKDGQKLKDIFELPDNWPICK
mgnify:FL=1